LFAVSWENGTVFRMLSKDNDAHVYELKTVLDSMPGLKIDFSPGMLGVRKMHKVNESIMVLATRAYVYSFCVAGRTLTLADSLKVHDPQYYYQTAYDADSLVVIVQTPDVQEIQQYKVTSSGKFVKSGTLPIHNLNWPLGIAYYAHGNVYLWDTHLDALLKEDDGFVYVEGPYYGAMLAPLMLPDAVAQVTMTGLDRIDLFSPNLELICTKQPTKNIPPKWSANYGDKIFMARSDGVSGWIPDTTVSRIHAPVLSESLLDVTIWPVPASAAGVSVSCERPIDYITISDLHGKVRFTRSYRDAREIVIPVDGMSAGLYCLTVESSGVIHRKTLVVVR
jgi:hypothetical protein